jgi:hypothetical protein
VGLGVRSWVEEVGGDGGDGDGEASGRVVVVEDGGVREGVFQVLRVWVGSVCEAKLGVLSLTYTYRGNGPCLQG